MENIYTAYTKLVDNKTYYFVKKFLSFPEIANASPVLESYGMHTDFLKACAIAGVTEAALREKLLKEANETLTLAKVIEFNPESFAGKKVSV